VGVVGNADEDLSAAREPLSDQPLPARVEVRGVAVPVVAA